MEDKIQRLKKSRLNIVIALLVFMGIISQLIIFPYLYAGEAHEEKSRFGVQGTIAQFSSEMKEAGVQITREWIEWEKIEPIKGQYNWEAMDKKVKAANQAGIEILGYFVQMPSWAKKKHDDLKPSLPMNKEYPPKKKYKKSKADFCEPKDISDFKRFTKAVAERYDGKHGHGEMKYIEILNEVLVPEFFEFKNPDNPYELWLVNGYQGIKEGNPNAEVLIGAFFDPIDSSGNPPKLFVKQFIERMLRDYTQYYDIVNFHSYSKESNGIARTAQYIKERMQAYDVNKPMWITETATLIGSKPTDKQEQLAKEVIKRYVRALGEGVEKVFWFPFVGLPTLKEDPIYGSDFKFLGLGWVYPKGQGLPIDEIHLRPAYCAYKTMTSKLAGFSSVVKMADTQYKFTVGGKSVYVLWCDSGTCTLPSEIGRTVKVTDYLGNEAIKNTVQITLTENPVFMENSGAAQEKKESRFGVNLGSLNYNSAVNQIRELGNIYVRNEIWGDLYGWKKVKIKKDSRLILASKKLCEKYCDPERSSSDPNNPQPKSYYCESGQLYFCRPPSREGLIEGMPPLTGFYENPNNLPFEWLVSVMTSRYDKKPPKNFLAGAYPYGNEDIYEGYIEYLVKRLGDKVKYWEIGNENDGAAFWAGTPKEYADMLVIASEEIRQNCADCKVGISFAQPALSHKFPERAEEWYLAIGNVCGSFDFIDAHFYSPYFIKQGELDRWKRICPGKEFISTETGVPDKIISGKKLQNVGGSPEKQAQDLVKYNTLLFAEGYSKIYWYLMDTDYGMGEIFLYNGLIDDVDNSRKPAFYSYKTMVSKVDYFTSISKLAEGQYKYTFSNKGPVYVLWCDSGTCTLPSEIAGAVKVTDYLGNEETKQASGVVLTEDPIFLE